MIKCVGVKLSGKQHYLYYNNNAMFRLQEDGQDALERSTEDTEAGLELAFKFFRILCEEANAARQHYGYDPEELPEWEDAKYEYTPADTNAMRMALYTAINLGVGREVPDLEDVDLILAEFEKKTESQQK